MTVRELEARVDLAELMEWATVFREEHEEYEKARKEAKNRRK
jgi:hypothetical protein